MTHRVALVTGAARGIGAATVRHLAGQGYCVLAVDWCAGDDPPSGVPYTLPTTLDLQTIAKEAGPDVHPYVADVRDRTAMGSAVAEAVERWGHVDAAVAAAAVMLGGDPQWETPDDELRLLWEIDFMGVWNTASAVMPAMLANENPHGCRFVAVASAAGRHGLFRLAGYTAAKHAVVGLVKGLAADLVGTGITAAAVSPGSTRTGMLAATAAIYDMEHESEFADQQLIRRLLEPEEIANVIAFCCSLEGAAINGSVIEATGGFPG
jgi:SDR family mycofactocin-dependent oxidoreductase